MYDQWNNVQRPLIFHGPMLSYPRYRADTLGDREKSTWTINKYLRVSVFLGISDSDYVTCNFYALETRGPSLNYDQYDWNLEYVF